MKSLIYTGQPDESLGFEDKPTPKPGNNQVQVRLSASALNHRDQWIRMGMYPGLQSNVTLGSDGCGIVTEIGAGVDHGWKGKEVVINPNNDWGPDPMAQSLNYHILGMPKDGTFGEFLVVDEDRIHPKPGHLTSEQAAALPLGGLTAFRACFTHGQIGPGKKVLVTGIGGGVALYALQFSNAVGAEVFVSSSSDAKIQKATGLGAKAGFNYRNKDWVKEAASVSGFDVIIDSAGGDAMNNYLKIIRPGGKIVFYGSTTGPSKGIDLFRMFWSQVSLQGSTMGNDEEFEEMLRLVDKFKIEPVIDSSRPFGEIISAMDEMHEGQQMGKLVLTF